MARYAQNTTCGQTCPWGAVDASLQDAFTVAAMKAAQRRESKETIVSEAPRDGGSDAGALEVQIPKLAIPQRPDALKSSRSADALTTGRSAASRVSCTTGASTRTNDKRVEAKMMSLIEKCLDKKVLEISQLRAPLSMASEVGLSARSTESAVSQLTQVEAPSHVETDTSVKAEPQAEAVTMAGRRAQAQKLSDASLGQFDGDQSRLAYLEMQKSAADARNKNRSALCFGYEPPSRTADTAKGDTMAGKRAQIQKVSDASLGKFDADQSRLAYLEMQKSAAEVRNKNRSTQCFDKAESPKYPALIREVETLAEKKGATHGTMAGKRAKAQKVSEATLGKFDADKSLDAYLDMQKSAEQLRNKHRVGQGIF